MSSEVRDILERCVEVAVVYSQRGYHYCVFCQARDANTELVQHDPGCEVLAATRILGESKHASNDE